MTIFKPGTQAIEIEPRPSSNLENKQYRKNLETICKPGKQAIEIEPRPSSNLENKQKR